MAVKLPLLWLPLLLFCLSRAEEQRCQRSASSCDECIQAGPECAWCTSPRANVRCATAKTLQSAGCQRRQIYNPTGTLQVLKNDIRTDTGEAVLLQPQEVSLHLRPGVTQSFRLSISTAAATAAAAAHPRPELIMDLSNVPAGVNVTFSSTTKGNPQHFEVSVGAAQCPRQSRTSNQNRTGPWSVRITPRGFSVSLKLELTLLCECSCTGNREENSPECSGHGTLVCGRCECNQPYSSQRCQTKGDSVSGQHEDLCRSSPNAPVCSGRGSCVEGFCECDMRAAPNETYSGRYCECSNFDCPHHNGRLCGGNGWCECGRCLCDGEWIGEACGCSVQTASCTANNQLLCNGRGLCECGACRCDPPFSGPTCEECPGCGNVCQERAACAECRAFGTGADEDTCDSKCGHLVVNMVETKEALQGRLCKMRSSEDFCFFYFSSLPSSRLATVARAKEC
ncbi:integrin beta-1-like [Fundulus diaphanus]